MQGTNTRTRDNPLESSIKLTTILLLLTSSTIALSEERSTSETPLPTVADKVEGLASRDGFFTVFPDDEVGTIWLQIENWNEDFLYASGLSSGLGSNPIGLDRGQWGETRVVRFKRVGRRVYLIERNLRYRAITTNPVERRAVEESFADSVIWATDIVARTGDRCLVDAKSLLIRDAHRVVNTLKSAQQGDFRLDRDRSFVSIDRCRAFPRNTELEATLTFASDKPGALVRQTAAEGGAFSLRLHHSLVKLPDAGYQTRLADPRVGVNNITFANYSAPLDAPLTQRFITRHRLKKADPSKSKSPPVKPIIYYLDPATPQPVRDALLDGARWWSAAFEAAGFMEGFQVLMLPANVDPMDVRYNVIQWVHRSTRGWSYGQSIVDPRSGEIIKGHVLLGSLRVRQDRLIIDGLTSAGPSVGADICSCCGIAGGGVDQALAQLDNGIIPLDVALARLRQLSAHEVGHTLGFSHNFAASTYGDRASVMDYPAPRVKIIDNDRLDLSDAYGVGVGQWDEFIVRYAYSTFADRESESKGLARLIDDAHDRGLIYLSDADARPAGAAHPLANLWDNGSDPIAELQHVMKVRRLALQKLGAGDLMQGRPLADFEIVLVPIYLFHRYQVAATAKLVGGFDYSYVTSLENGNAVEPVSVERQQQALDELLKTLDPNELVIRQRLLRLLAPKPFSSLDDSERFATRTAMIFDPSLAAQIAADLTLSQILQPQRASRLAAYPQSSWGLRHVLEQTVSRVWKQPVAKDERSREVQRIVQRVLIQQLITLAGDSTASESVRATAEAILREMDARLSHETAPKTDHRMAVLGRIRRFLNRPHTPAQPSHVIPAPPGSPIGN